MPIGENFYGKDLVLGILAKQPDALTDNERDILRARAYYLTSEEKERYGIGEFAEDEEEEDEEEETPKPKKKKK